MPVYQGARNKSGPTRRTVRPLSVRVTGEIRTRDLQHRRCAALSTELQRHAWIKLNEEIDNLLRQFLDCG